MPINMLRPRVQSLPSRERTGWADPIRGSSSARGYGGAWQKLRRRILERDRGLCRVCARAGRVTLAAEVDHIVNKAAGGTDDERNLQAICRPCHQRKTLSESRRPRA